METHTPYLIRTLDHATRPTVPTGSAETIHGALDAAWALNRHAETQVEILDTDEGNRRVAALDVAWSDEDDLVLVALPEKALRHLREVWERGGDNVEIVAAVRDVFGCHDGLMPHIDEVLGHTGNR